MSDESTSSLSPGVAPGVIRVHSDIACPWSHVLVHRLRQHVSGLGITGELRVEHRALPLELINGVASPVSLLNAEIEVLREVEPDAGWTTFDGEASSYPVTSLPALTAVQAAQDPAIGSPEALDAALRQAYFAEWRNVSLYPVIFEVAATVEGIDVDAMAAAIRSGRPQAEVWRHFDEAQAAGVEGSPQVELSDGTVAFNPGFEFHWEGGGPGEGRLTIDQDDPGAVARLVEAAMASMHFD